MMSCLDLPNAKIFDYCSKEKQRYSIWVYDGNDIIQIFYEQMPNTVEVWFEFHTFSYLYWRLLENECYQEYKGNKFFNYFKIRKFLINYLLCGTNIPDVFLQRESDGKLTEESFDSVMKIHPRILQAFYNLFDLYPKTINKAEEKDIEKQCMKLFGKGQSVSDPHPLVITYCNLLSFWDKLGLNYFDLMKMPYNTFSCLKRIMSMDNDFHSQSLKDKTQK